jgi:hypothetical protein
MGSYFHAETGLQFNAVQQSSLNKNMTTLHLKKSIGRSLLRRGILLFPLALACFALSPTAPAVSPPPDGGYANLNTAEGTNALFSLTSGVGNTATGDGALFANTTGSQNTATGLEALSHNTTGSGNTATGLALFNNTTGIDNTATGFGALNFNKTGTENTANGFKALYNNTGGDNTATGFGALYGNTTGYFNTANGLGALFSNTTASYNTATGFHALYSNTAFFDTANGAQALFSNTTGGNNTAEGTNALYSNTNGSNNTAAGFEALFHNTTGSSNIALGLLAGLNLTTGSNNIDIGNVGSAGESNNIRIGTVGTQTATFIAGIHGVTVASAVGVVVDVNGHLGTVTSSARFKEAIKPMDKASEAILNLKPVTFRYKEELDPGKIPQFGLIAEEVEKVNSDLVVRGEDGKVMTVRYEAVNAMLLNEFLKEHRKVEEQGAIIAQQRKDFASELAREQKDFKEKFAQQQNQIEALTATVQKVSDQIALSKPAPQLVANP